VVSEIIYEVSETFQINYGVKQGYLFSPILFNLVVEWMIKPAIATCKGVYVSLGFTIRDLDYANDEALLGGSVVKA